MDLFAQLARQGAMIERLAADSRRCAPGVAFFAFPGERVDGRQFIPEAKFVPSGVAELGKLQGRGGYAYIKP